MTDFPESLVDAVAKALEAVPDPIAGAALALDDQPWARTVTVAVLFALDDAGYCLAKGFGDTSYIDCADIADKLEKGHA